MSSICLNKPDEIAAGIETGEHPEALKAIFDAGIGAAIWRRQTRPSLLSWIDKLDSAVLPKTRIVVKPTAIGREITQLFDNCGMPEHDEKQCLIDDIREVANQFSRVMSAPYLRLRLDVVRDDAFRKFHIDHVRARLVCTYRGQGTEYGVSYDGGDPEQINRLQTGSVMVLRGALWPGRERSGVLHRSPPVAGFGETRLLLVLDPLTEPE